MQLCPLRGEEKAAQFGFSLPFKVPGEVEKRFTPGAASFQQTAPAGMTTSKPAGRTRGGGIESPEPPAGLDRPVSHAEKKSRFSANSNRGAVQKSGASTTETARFPLAPKP